MPEQILVNLRKKYSEDAYPAIKGFSTQHIRTFFKSIERKMGPNDLASKNKCFSNALRHTLVALEMH